MLHQSIAPAYRHPIHSWEVADNTALLAISVSAADIGKVALQQDIDELFFLANNVGPEWKKLVSGAEPALDRLLAGNMGTEGSGISVDGTTYEATAKVSDIDGPHAAQQILHKHSTTLQPIFLSARSNSDTDAHASVAADAALFSLMMAGWAGASYKVFAEIQGKVAPDGTISDASNPGELLLRTTKDGEKWPTTALRIKRDQSAVLSGSLEVLAGALAASSRVPTMTQLLDAVPLGGTTGQVLTKLSATDHDVDWADATGGGGGASRTVLTANRTYYVRTDGNNANTGLVDSAGGAFLTVQKAIDVIADTLDIQSFTVTIQIRDGTYTTPILLRPYVGTSGFVAIDGNSITPSNVLLHTTSNNVFTMRERGSNYYQLRYVKMQTTTSGICIFAQYGNILFNAVVFGAAAGGHMFAGVGALIQPIGNYTIDGGTGYHVYAANGGQYAAGTLTVTLTGTPAFGTAYVYIVDAGYVRMSGHTFTGAATGKRYTVQQRGAFCGSASTTYLPGSVVGTVTTESFYGLGT